MAWIPKRWVLLGGICAAAMLLATVPSALGTNPGDGGGGWGTISCQASGNTSFGANAREFMGGCSSYVTGYSGHNDHHAIECWADGYTAYVWRVVGTDWTLRWSGGPFCNDGVWHFSAAWGSNENRVSAMYINQMYTDWWMIQYRR